MSVHSRIDNMRHIEGWSDSEIVSDAYEGLVINADEIRKLQREIECLQEDVEMLRRERRIDFLVLREMGEDA